jgi:hypothetical protein
MSRSSDGRFENVGNWGRKDDWTHVRRICPPAPPFYVVEALGT